MSEKTEFDSTMEALRRAENALPDFTSSYDSQIRRLYDEIVNRPAFRYDPQSDPLYRSYREQAVTEGERAMRDTMGQAASLTGGYGSSYAQSVGQQEYGRYLERLGQVMPQLYKAAWERYSAEGDELKGLFDSTMALAQDEVGRARERYDLAARLEEQAYQREQDKLDRELAKEQLQYQRQQASYSQALSQDKLSFDRTEKSYKNLVSLISQSGYSPSAAELAAAGMTRAQAQALRSNYLLKNPVALALSGELPKLLNFGGGYTEDYSSSSTPVGIMTGHGIDTNVGLSPGLKEQLKLSANLKGSNTGGKTRRLG